MIDREDSNKKKIRLLVETISLATQLLKFEIEKSEDIVPAHNGLDVINNRITGKDLEEIILELSHEREG